MLSNSSAYFLLGVVFVVGALLVALGTWLVRREKAAASVASGDVFALDIDQIERLAIVGRPWCIEQLERDFLHDKDERVRNAAEDAIVVIRARG